MASSLFLLLAALLVAGVIGDNKNNNIGENDPTSLPMPQFKVDLDKEPEQRWKVIARVYYAQLHGAWELMQTIIPDNIKHQFGTFLNDAGEEIGKKLGDYSLEIKGISDVTGIPHGDLIMMNVVYELTAKCTSIVAQHEDGSIYHGRNLDFGSGGAFTTFLRSIAMEVHFIQNGTVVSVGTTYAGYVGMLTIQRPGYFTYSIDEVVEGPAYAELLNVMEGLLDPNVSMMGFLIRDLALNSTFTEAVNIMSTHDIVAPAFFIMGGTTEGEGVVITRERNKAIDQWWLDADNGAWWRLETNYNHWNPPPAGDDRRDPANQCMENMGQANLSLDTLYGCLSEQPVLNEITTYTAVMHAVEGAYVATIRECCSD